MKEIMLDHVWLQEPEAAHPYLQERLNLPEYYGRNLDALYDCLTEIGEETVLRIGSAGTEESAFYRRLLRVLEDAAEENPKLTLVMESDSDAPDTDRLYEEILEDNAEDDSVVVQAGEEADPRIGGDDFAL